MIADDYRKIWYTYLPSGFLWPGQEGDSPFWDMYAEAQAQEWGRIDEDALELVKEAIPDGVDYPDDLLDYWERVTDLDPSGLTDVERRQALIAKLRGRGSPTLARFQETAETFDIPVQAIDNYRLVDSFEQSAGNINWTEGGTADITYDAAEDPDGGTLADIVEFPLSTDYITADILRIANYEQIYVSGKFRLVGNGTHTFQLSLLGRDGATKYTDTVSFTSEWVRYSFIVDDVGTGGADPVFRIELTSGSNVVLNLYDIKGGWRERYYPALGAIEMAGDPTAPGWVHVWGLEYGEDLIDRDVSDNPDWAISGSGHVHENYGADPISRQVLAEGLHDDSSGIVEFSVDILTGASTADVRVSFWVFGVYSLLRVYLKDKAGANAYDSGWFTLDSWYKVEQSFAIGSGGANPKIVIALDGDLAPGTEILVGHVRASSIITELENQIAGSTPLHTAVIFHSYGELTECTE